MSGLPDPPAPSRSARSSRKKIGAVRATRFSGLLSNRTHLTLGAKLVCVIMLCVLTAMISVAYLFQQQARNNADTKARAIATAISKGIVERIQKDFERSFDIVSTTNASLMALWAHDSRDRRLGNILLKQMLEADSDRFGSWVVFKPDAFDGRDKGFVDTAGSDGSGRYLSYWHQNGMEVTLDRVQGYDDADNALYQTPINRGHPYLSEPYFIQNNDRKILTVSYAEPVTGNDKSIGAIGIDVALTPLDDTISALSLPVGSAITLISPAGFVIAATDPKIDQKSLMTGGRPTLLTELKRAMNGALADQTIDTPAGPIVRSWYPITLKSLQAPWYVLSEIPIRAYAADAERQQAPALFAAAGILVAMMAAIFVAVRTMVTKPLGTIRRFITTLRDENGPQQCAAMGRADEIGAIAKTLTTFKAAEVELDRLRHSEAEQNSLFTARRRSEHAVLADQLAKSVQGVAQVVEKTSRSIMRRAEAVAATAVTSVDRTKIIADVSMAADHSISAVDQAASALRLSIDGVADKMADASRIATAAADEAIQSSCVTDELSTRAGRIGEIVALITAIASRTNMLALNATIEAARAGEAGRGFAIVAQEVKALAAQTTDATVEIDRQIKAMQQTASSAAMTLTTIGASVTHINTISHAIVEAVLQQGDATARISTSVDEAIIASRRVASVVAEVDRAAMQTGDAAAEMLIETSALNDESARLNDEVIDFITRIRAA